MEDYRKPKPDWLRTRLRQSGEFHRTGSLLRSHSLHTICESGKCPNIRECWASGTATFMILGDICTRSCRFCNTKTGKPLLPDPDEPNRVALAAASLSLQYVVITSVDRDDLPDFGASHWVTSLQALKTALPHARIEALIPDFQGNENLIRQLTDTQPFIIGHNLETVHRLTPSVRSRASYALSLKVIRQIAEEGISAKSGFMTGLGETREEIEETLFDLRKAGCERVTIGQYLRPTPQHLPVAEYVHPDVFDELHDLAIRMGFLTAECGPLVRSSYHAANQA